MNGSKRAGTIATFWCDESGVCEVMEAERRGLLEPRCFERRANAVAMVDISPLALGHCLIVSRDHVTSTLDLSAQAIAESWALARVVADRLARVSGGRVLTLEHGLRPHYLGQSCVRHAHIHVCPVAADAGETRRVLDAHLTDWRSFSNREDAVHSVDGRAHYLLGHLGDEWFAGVPDSSIRQVTRATLAALVKEPPIDIDWYFGAGNELLHRTLALIADGSTPAGLAS